MAEKYIKLEDACSLILELSGGFEWLEIGTDLLIEKLKAIPAADVKPVVRGKWIKDKRSLWCLVECSACGDLSVEDGANYCPNCGADMREAQEKPNHTVLTAGNCTVCRKPLEDGTLFLCKDCQERLELT